MFITMTDSFQASFVFLLRTVVRCRLLRTLEAYPSVRPRNLRRWCAAARLLGLRGSNHAGDMDVFLL